MSDPATGRLVTGEPAAGRSAAGKPVTGNSVFEPDRFARCWSITPALVRGIALPVLSIALGVVLGRPDLVVVLAPVLVGTLLAVPPVGERWRPLKVVDSEPVSAVSVVGPRIVESAVPARIAVEIQPTAAQVAVVALPPAENGRARHVALRAPRPDEPRRQLVLEVEPPSWGVHELLRPDHLFASADGLYMVGPVKGIPFTAQVLPALDSALPPGPLPPRPTGIVGAHHTRRRGPGSELYDIAPFQPGDRLRRIDWRVTARQTGPREQLFTRHTLTDSDADIVCCLDNRYDLRTDVTSWPEPLDAQSLGTVAPGSLDIAVTTVLSLARSYLAQGDRVGILDLSRPFDVLQMGSGRRHLRRLRVHIARHARRPGTGDAVPLPRRLPDFPAGALVIVTSVFLDDDIARFALSWRRAGHPVLAVDVLPSPLDPAPDTETTTALRLVLAERADRLRSMSDHGIAVTTAEPARLVLELARLSRAPRVSRR